MFTDLASIRSAVNDRLTAELPTSWKSVSTIEGTIKSRTPVLYLEFTAIEQRVQNQNLPHGQVVARFNLIITDPRTDTEKAEDAVDEHVLRLIRAVDKQTDLYWDTCNKTRLPDGPLAWTLTAFALTNTPDPDTEE